jgi:ribosomal protein S13
MKSQSSIFHEFMQNFGISKSLSLNMCKVIKVSPLKPAEIISPFKKQKAFQFLKDKQIKIGFELKNEEVLQFVHLYTIKHLKSLKHKFFLPINGQRNKTNANTAKKMANKIRPLIYKQLKQISKRTKKNKKN